MPRYKTKRLRVSYGKAEAGGYRAYVSRETTSPDQTYSPIVKTDWFHTEAEAKQRAKKYRFDFGIPEW